jgi:hypothetical protein
VLRSRSGRILAKHYAGPTWEASDGSKVVGEVAAKSPAPQAHSGREVKVPYSAEYRFFKVPAP